MSLNKVETSNDITASEKSFQIFVCAETKLLADNLVDFLQYKLPNHFRGDPLTFGGKGVNQVASNPAFNYVFVNTAEEGWTKSLQVLNYASLNYLVIFVLEEISLMQVNDSCCQEGLPGESLSRWTTGNDLVGGYVTSSHSSAPNNLFNQCFSLASQISSPEEERKFSVYDPINNKDDSRNTKHLSMLGKLADVIGEHTNNIIICACNQIKAKLFATQSATYKKCAADYDTDDKKLQGLVGSIWLSLPLDLENLLQVTVTKLKNKVS